MLDVLLPNATQWFTQQLLAPPARGPLERSRPILDDLPDCLLPRSGFVRDAWPASSLVGKTFGHLRDLEQIGAGGMGAVCRAVDGRPGREVATKTMPSHRVALVRVALELVALELGELVQNCSRPARTKPRARPRTRPPASKPRSSPEDAVGF